MPPTDPPRSPDNEEEMGPVGWTGEDAQRAEQALLGRPEISIRTRIVAVFLILFVLCSGATVGAVALLSSFESRILFLERADRYSFEIEEARRNEKNFFLYGTGLPEAFASASLALNYLEQDSIRVREVVGSSGYAGMTESLERYIGLLRQLMTTENSSPGEGQQEIEVALRTEGAGLLRDAQEMIEREENAVSAMLHTSRVMAIGFLALMLLTMVLFGSYVIRAVLGPLARFSDYMGRIGSGNFQPIKPARRYRDEFSRLAVAFNQTILEIQNRQEQLLQSGKMAAVGTLTSGIAHELNNPLNNIGLTVEALLDDFEDLPDEDKRRMLSQAYTQVERAGATVRNLLDFTRKGRPVFARFQVGKAVDTAKRLVSNEARLAGVTWSVSLPQDLPEVRGHPHDLQQVFLNLFLNAIQAMSEGGELSVEAADVDGDWVRVSVSDTGPGIPPEHIPEIFDPFFTTKGPGMGTGLGLSVSHGIVEEHGGRIEVSSETGKGTTFSVYLPVAEAS
ncbi:MAG: ATP-binding protein [Gemmatimonadota bacterium]|jgi:signal transduction histidine kinase